MTAFRVFASLIAAAIASPLVAADDPLDAIPGDAGVLVRLAPPAEVSGALRPFAQAAAPQFAPFADQVGPGLGSLIGNPTLAGVDAERPWYVAVFPRADRRPAVVFGVPTSDAAALKRAVGQGYTFAEHEDWALYSTDAEAVEAIRDRGTADDKKESIRKALAADERLAAVFAEGEIAVFLNVPALRTAYRPQIDASKGQFEALLEAAATQGDAATKAGLEMNRRFVSAAFRALDDATGAAARVTIGEQALTSEELVTFAADSPSAKRLAGHPASDFPKLSRLPADRLAYFGVSGNMSELIAESMKVSAPGLPAEKAEELRRETERLRELKFGPNVGAFGLGDLEGGVFRGVQIAEVDRPEAYREIARRMIKVMSHVETGGMQQDYTLTPDAETVGGVKADRIKVVMTADPNVDPTGNMQKFLSILFGRDGMTQWMTTLDGLLVQVVGDRGELESAVTRLKAGDAGRPSEAIVSGRTGLSERANLLVLGDLARFLAEAAKLAAASGEVPLAIDAEAIDDLGLKPSYLGVTVVTDGPAVRVRGSLPAAQVRGLVALFGVFQTAVPR